MPKVTARSVDAAAFARLGEQGCDPRLARLYAARGLTSVEELATTLKALVSPDRLHHVDDAARLLADSIASKERLLIVADYDADGATACAVGVKALRAMGAGVDYLVPNRFEHGYGLTPEIVQEAAKRSPDLLITVDNGIAAVEGIAEANRLGMRVLVTDHHLPGAQIPAAACIVNPNQAGCGFPSKHLAGVGVIFYVMLALRAELRRRGTFSPAHSEPNLSELLGLVALWTVGDAYTLAIHRAEWHTGVVGLLASRLKDRYHRPVFAFAAESGGRLKGSGRSIAGFHLRDALDLVDKRHPGLLERFGGHAGAAGATLRAAGLEEFPIAFEAVAREMLTPADLAQRLETHGGLAAAERTADFAQLLKLQVWGQGFPEPRFRGRFAVETQRVVGEKHLKLTLELEGRRFSAIRFGSAQASPNAG